MMKSEWLCVNCTNVLENIDDRKSLCIYNLMHLRLKHEWDERKANIKDVKKKPENSLVDVIKMYTVTLTLRRAVKCLHG